MGDKKKEIYTKVKPHDRKNPKSPGKHHVKGHERKVGQKTQVKEHWREVGGARDFENTDHEYVGRELDKMGATDEDKAEYWKWRNHHENLDYEFKNESREGFSTVKIYRAKTCGCEKREVTNNMGDTHIEYATCLEHQHLYPDMFKKMRDNDVERVVD